MSSNNTNLLARFSDEELEEELKLREARKTIPHPLPQNEVNLTILNNTIAEHLLSIANNGYGIRDGEHYIYEETLKALYGKDVFSWINEYCTR
jgi:hypothetical protein